jgi:hypothetical protein
MIGDGVGPLGVFGDYVEVPYASGENSLIAFAATDIYVVSPCKNASIGVETV